MAKLKDQQRSLTSARTIQHKNLKLVLLFQKMTSSRQTSYPFYRLVANSSMKNSEYQQLLTYMNVLMDERQYILTVFSSSPHQYAS